MASIKPEIYVVRVARARQHATARGLYSFSTTVSLKIKHLSYSCISSGSYTHITMQCSVGLLVFLCGSLVSRCTRSHRY